MNSPAEIPVVARQSERLGELIEERIVTGAYPPGRKQAKVAVSKSGATVRIGPGPVIEARSADGRLARIEAPEPPQPLEPVTPPVPPRS